MSKWSKKNLKEVIKNNVTIAGCLRDMNLSPTGSNYTSFKMKTKDFNISTSHFSGKQLAKGISRKPNNKIPLKDILIKESKYLNTSH